MTTTTKEMVTEVSPNETVKRRGRIVFYQDKGGEFRWTLHASNGRIIDASTQGYKRRKSCVDNGMRFATNTIVTYDESWDL